MSLASGTATFNSCNKPGSIVEFTNHLRIHPNDYNALMWRARAYGIVGQPQNALRDIEHAISVSSGVKRENAKAQKIRNTGSIEDYGRHANRTVTKYPNEWSAWSELAQYYKDIGNQEEATRCNLKSLDLAAKYNETRDPFICWINFDVGNHWMRNGDFDTSKRYFEAAIESSPTHTASYIQLCRCNIIQGNVPAARQYFYTAISLNPNLTSQEFKTENFDKYSSRFRQEIRQLYTSASSSASGNFATAQASGGRAMGGATGGSRGGNRSGNFSRTQTSNKTGDRAMGGTAGGSGGRNNSGNFARPQASQKTGDRAMGGATGGSGGGNGNRGDDGGNDGGDNDISATWKRLQREALSIKRYKDHKYVQSKCGKYWYSRDTARHGGAQFKRYENTNSSLRFKDSVDANLKPLVTKHESHEGEIIRKADMIGVK